MVYITSLQACKVGSCICVGLSSGSASPTQMKYFIYLLFLEPSAPSDTSPPILDRYYFRTLSILIQCPVTPESPPLARSDIHIPYTSLPWECDCVNNSLSKETPTTNVGVKIFIRLGSNDRI